MVHASCCDSLYSRLLPMIMRYVTDRITLTVGPSATCSPPRKVFPLLPYFTEKQTVSTTQQYSAGLQASMPPSLTLQTSSLKGMSVNHHQITAAINPIDIRAGENDSMVWEYKTNIEAESHLELSRDHPPEHKLCYRLSSKSRMPDNFKIKLEVTYHRKRIPRRFAVSNFPPIFRFLRDVTV